MPQQKALVFISHIGDEKEVAVAFKDLVEQAFLGMIEVFVSSDEHSIQMGQKWLDQITTALKTCTVEIVVCSPSSINRPWINFEAGAGWIRDIPVVPLCHSGMQPSSLPMPLNLLQAATATEVSGLEKILPVLAKAIGSRTPTIDFSKFIETVKAFERRHTFWNEASAALSIVKSLSSDFFTSLRSGDTQNLDLSQTNINSLEPHFQFLLVEKLLHIEPMGIFTISKGVGASHRYTFQPLSRFKEVIEDQNLKLGRL